MNVGMFVSRFVCDRSIDDELSIMKRTSRLRFEITALVSVCGRSASVGAQGGGRHGHDRDRRSANLSVSCAQR